MSKLHNCAKYQERNEAPKARSAADGTICWFSSLRSCEAGQEATRTAKHPSSKPLLRLFGRGASPNSKPDASVEARPL